MILRAVSDVNDSVSDSRNAQSQQALNQIPNSVFRPYEQNPAPQREVTIDSRQDESSRNCTINIILRHSYDCGRQGISDGKDVDAATQIK